MVSEIPLHDKLAGLQIKVKLFENEAIVAVTEDVDVPYV